VLWLVIGAGGAIGALLRYAVGSWIQSRSQSEFPMGTLLINVTGCFLFGLLFAFLGGAGMSKELRLFLFTGLLGGFTTYSTFGFESVSLMQRGHTGLAFGYIAASLVLGLGATWLGLSLAQGELRN
jgi:CrcB protein